MMLNSVVKYKLGYCGACASDDALGSFNYIHDDIHDIKKRYITLGFHLYEFERLEYYKQFGYDCLKDFVYDNFGIEHTGLSRILSVYYRFAERNGSCSKMWIDSRFENYSYSQLVEMVKLSDDDIAKNIKPEMSVKSIREYAKNKKNSKKCDVALSTKTNEKVLTKQEKCASASMLPEPDLQRPFDERYQLATGRDLFIDVLDCLKNNIKNVDKVQAIVKLINDSGL